MAQTKTRRPQNEAEELDLVQDGEEFDEDVAEETAVVPAKGSASKKKQTGEVSAAPAKSAAVRTEGEKSGNFITRFFENTVEYFREVRDELRKVAWLSREEVLRLTRIVLVVIVISSIVLGLIGFLLGLLTNALAAANTSVIAGGVTIAFIIIVAGLWLVRDRATPKGFE